MDIDSLAQALFGGRRAEEQEVETNATTRTYMGVAVSDSSDGTVRVDLGGDVTLPDDLYDEDGNVVAEWDGAGIEMSTSPQVREGQDVIVTLVGGTSTKRPMVTAVAGEGDYQNERIGAIEADYVKATELEADVADIGFLKADSATIADLQADTAKVHDLTADQLTAATGYVGELQAGSVSAQDIVAGKATVGQLAADHVSVSDLDAATARIGDLETDNVTITGRLSAAEIDIDAIEADYLKAADMEAEQARVGTLLAGKADVSDLTAATARIGDLEADHVSVSDFSAEQANIDSLQAATADIDTIRANSAKVKNLTAEQLEADHATVGSLSTTYATITNLNAANGRITNLESATADIDTIRANSAKVQNLTAAQLEADHAKVGQLDVDQIAADHATIGTLDTTYATIANLDAANGRITNLESTKANISDLEADYITADVIEATYMHANMSNSDVAWIENGTIKNGAIVSAMINDVSANKLTAGTINGSVINVTNLNADNITTGTINGQRIGDGSLSLSKLDESVYTEAEVNSIVDGLNDRIDGAIETFTGTVVPTLNNSPASSWNTTKLRDEHVGDVYYVVNSQSQQNGYCYRFTKSGSTYSWQLIKDSDVTAALSRLTTAEGKITTFDSDISTLKTDTGTLTTRTTNLETRADDVDATLLDKVDVTTFNEVSDTVDAHTQTISQHTTAISNKADSSTVTAVTNRVSKNEQDISGINTTIGELQDTVETKADGSTVSTISSKLNTVSDTVDGHTQAISSVQNTLSTKADSSTVSTLTTKVNTVSDTVDGHTQRLSSVEDTLETKADGSTVSTISTKVNNISDTVDGHTSQLQSVTSTQTSMQSTLDKTVKSSIQLWYSKANTTAPSKPTSQVTSTSTNGGAWRTVVPSYNASYPHYFYCWQYEYVDGTYGWSAVVRDIAMGESQATARTADSNASAAVTTANTASTNASTALTTANTANTNASEAKTAATTASTTASEAKTTAETAASDASTAKTNAASAVTTANSASTTATNAQNTANANIKSSVQLWFTKANSTAPSKPTSVVSTSNANTANAWNLVVPVWNSSYPHYYYCYQQQKGDGTYQWTDVVYDRATSEAQQLANTTSTNLSTLQTDYATFKQTTQNFESTIGTTYATKTELQTTDDKIENLEIGGRNLLRNSSVEYSQSSSTATWFEWQITDAPLETSQDYTFSFDAKTSNGTDVFYVGFANGSSTTQENMATGVKPTTDYRRMSVTARTTKTNIRSIVVSSTTQYGRGNGSNSGGTLYIKNVKLEKGNHATDWSPSPEDVDAAITAKVNSKKSVRLHLRRDSWNDAQWGEYASVGHADNFGNVHYASDGGTSATGFDASTLNVGDLIVVEGISTGTSIPYSATAKVTSIPASATGSIPATVISANNAKAIESRVANAETSIIQTNNQIALKANSSDVYTKTDVDGKITQEVTDRNAAITAKANEITSTVSQTYTTKQEFADLEVGGRNLLKYSRDYSQGYGGTKTGAFDDVDGTYQQCTVWKHTKSQSSSYEEALSTTASIVSLWTVGPDEDYVLSFWAKASASLSIHSYFYNGNNNTCDLVETSTGYKGSGPDGSAVTNIGTEWARYWVHWHFNSNTDPTIRKNLIVARMQDAVTGTVWIAGPKLEKGTRATDWSPAPEDAEERVDKAESSITQNATNINAKVSKNDVINQINLSTEGVLIDADRVEIDGAAVFSAISSNVDTAITNKGYATTSQAQSYATTAVSNLVIGGRNLIGKFNWDNSTFGRGRDWYSIDPIGVVSSSYTDSSGWTYDNSQWHVNLDAGTYQLTIFVDTKCEAWTSASCQILNSSSTVIDAFGSYVFNNGGKQTKTFTLASNTDVGIKVKPGKGCVFRIKLENGTKPTDWTAAPEDLKTYSEDSASEAIEGIQVGGRNLLATSGAAYSYPRAGTSSGHFIDFNVANGYLLPYELEAGVEYTFSVDVTSSITPFIISVGAGSNGFSKDVASKEIASSGRVSITFTPTADQLSLGKMFAFRVPRYSTSGTSYTYSVDRPKLEIGNKATDWSPAPEDIVSRTQRIYYRWNSATAPAAPSTWVTKNDDGTALWTKMHVAITSTHKYIYTCEQYEMADGTIGHTDVLLDNTITVIDGGNIITGSVYATALNASSINASKSLTVGAMTDAAAATILNSEIEVGGRNLVSSIPSNWNQTTIHESSEAGASWSTVSGHPVNNRISVVDLVPIDGSCLTSRIASGYYVFFAFFDANGYMKKYLGWTDNVTFDIPSGATGVGVAVRKSDNSAITIDEITNVKLKLERGNKATDWTPAPEDVDADISEAAQTATNYITTIDTTNGIKIANASPSSATTYLQLASTFLDFIRGGVSMLKAWIDETTATAKVRVGAEQIDGTDTFNTLTDNEGIKLRRGTTVLSQFATNLIELGKNSTSAVIEFCGGKVKLLYDTSTKLISTGTTGAKGEFYTLINYEGVANENSFAAIAARGQHLSNSAVIGVGATYDGSQPTYASIMADGLKLDTTSDTSWVIPMFDMHDVVNAIPVTLYDNDSASASAATTLSESAANFRRLTIMYKDQDNTYSSVDVWEPNGKRVALDLTWINGASTQQMYQRVRWVTISGTTISTAKDSGDSKYRTGQVRLGGSYSVTNNDYISIVHVIGYR